MFIFRLNLAFGHHGLYHLTEPPSWPGQKSFEGLSTHQNKRITYAFTFGNLVKICEHKEQEPLPYLEQWPFAMHESLDFGIYIQHPCKSYSCVIYPIVCHRKPMIYIHLPFWNLYGNSGKFSIFRAVFPRRSGTLLMWFRSLIRTESPGTCWYMISWTQNNRAVLGCIHTTYKYLSYIQYSWIINVVNQC